MKFTTTSEVFAPRRAGKFFALAFALLVGAGAAHAQPSVPGGLALVGVGDAPGPTLSFTWNASTGGSGRIDYIVQLRELPTAFPTASGAAGNAWPSYATVTTGLRKGTAGGGRGFLFPDTNTGNTARWVVFADLRGGTTYEARVRSEDTNFSQSAWAVSAQVTTAAAKKPSAPSAELLARTEDSMVLRWGAPSDGGSEITGYKVRWAEKNSPENYLNTGGASGVDADANARRYVLENLAAGTFYRAQVRAVNSVGDGDWSAVRERGLPFQSGIKGALCIHPVGARPGTFDECLQAARNGYTISESAGGEQRFEITIFFFEHFPEDVGALTLDLQTRNDPVNPLVANTDTDGALPAINGIRRNPDRPLQHFTFPAFAITPKTSGDGGRINIAFSTSTDIDKFHNLPAEERQDTFLQIAEAGVNFTAPDSNNACPATNNAAVSSVEVAEAGNAKTVCVSLKSDPGESVSVSCAALPNALGETTVSASPAKLSFTSANRRRGQALTLTAPDNNSAFVASGTHALNCTASGGIGSDYSALVEELAITLTDADVVSTSGAALSVTGALSKNGGAQEVKITATLGGDIVPGEACTVATAFGASKLSNSPSASLAVSGTDYTAFTAPSITIPAGKNTASTTLSITPSASVSEIKSITFTAANISCGLSTVTFAAAEVLIVDAAVVITDCSDNDSTTLELEEGAAAENICVKLAGNAPSSDVTVTCSGAADPALFTSAQTRTFTSANHETEQTFPIVAVDNNLAFSTAPTDTLTCTAAADVSTGYSGLTDEITVTVKDDTAPDTISTAGATLSFTHASTSRTGTVVAIAALDGDIAPQEDCTVTLTKGSAAIADTRGDALAVEGTDYDAFTAPSITIPAGSLFGKATFHPPVERNTGRDKKSIPFSGAAASCGDATGIAFAEAEILLLNTSPLVTQADADGTCPAAHNDPIAQPLPLTEGGTAVTVCLSLPLDPAEFDPGAMPVIRCVGPDGTETIWDGQSTADSVNIGPAATGGDAGDWNLGRAVGIAAPDDNIAEGDRIIGHTCDIPTFRGFGPYELSDSAALNLRISDDDAVATTGKLSGAVREGGGAQTATITAEIDGDIVPPKDCALTVSLGTSAISGTRGDKVAAANTHYTGTPNPSTITISGREASGDMTFSFTPVVDGDNDIESIPLTAAAACGGKGTFVSNAQGSNNGSDTITFTGEILIGDAAPSLAVPKPSRGELALTWRAPVVEVGGTAHTAYKVRWADANDADAYLNTDEETGQDVPGGATAISYTVSGLTDGTTYQVQVGAVYGGGDAQWSFARESVPGELPGAPRNLTASVGDGTITPAWDAPDDGGAAISEYRVRHSEGAGSSNWQPDDDGASVTETEYEISGLTNGTTYEIQVAAVNALGTGAWASHQTSPVAPPPDAPTGLSATSGAGAIALSWTAPANTGDEALTDYAVRYSEGAGSSNWLPDDDGLATASTNLAYDLTGVKSATTYEVQVAARNRAGPGPFTASVQSVTPEFDPDINGDSSVTWQDGVLIARHLAGVRGANLIADMGGTNLNADNVAAHIAAGVAAGDLDMDGANGTTLADGIMLTRYLLGMRAGDGITTRMSGTAEATVISNIEALVQ